MSAGNAVLGLPWEKETLHILAGEGEVSSAKRKSVGWALGNGGMRFVSLTSNLSLPKKVFLLYRGGIRIARPWKA